MAQTITQGFITERLGELDSYGEWQTAQRAQQYAERSTPGKVDTNNREHLKAQTLLLDARDEEGATRSALLVELGEQDDNFLPLVHRLGLLAAFDNLENHDELSLRRLSYSFNKEDQVHVASKPIARAIQIADELTAVMAAL
jgi:hypothetical protein